MRVSRVSVGVNCECLESVVYMGGDDDPSDHCLLGQEKLDMSSRGTWREDVLQARTLQVILDLLNQRSFTHPQGRHCRLGPQI